MAAPRRSTAPLANATLLGVGPLRDLERAIARPGQPLAKGSTPHIPEAEDHWQSFEDLGLAPAPRPAADRRAKLARPAARLLGGALLALGAVVLAGYLASMVFYYLSTSWIAPVRVSPADDRVASLRAELAAQQGKRDRLVEELAQAERRAAGLVARAASLDARARAELAQERQAREALMATLVHQTEVIAALAQSPYLRALAGGAAIAFVPYGNGAATPGAPVYACRAAMVSAGRSGPWPPSCPAR
jgi:hypothetical protein